MVEDEVVRPRRITRQPLYLQDYEVSYPQKQLTFADEQVNTVMNADVLSCIREMREESKQLRQDVKRISDIIASSPVLAQVSSPSQHSLSTKEEVSSTPMATSNLASHQDDRNPGQSEHVPLAPPRDDSLHAHCDRHQDLIEDLTNHLNKIGRLSSSQLSSGQSTPQYTEPPKRGNNSPQHDPGHTANVRSLQQRLSNPPHWQSDDAMSLQHTPPFYSSQGFSRSPADAHTYHSHAGYQPVRNFHDSYFGDGVHPLSETALLDHSTPHLQRDRRTEHYRGGERPYPSDRSYPFVDQDYNRPLHPMPVQYRGPTPTIPDFI
ncbi:MAG: hypothetical protein ACRDC4_03315, partial [Plesiomonas sp.]